LETPEAPPLELREAPLETPEATPLETRPEEHGGASLESAAGGEASVEEAVPAVQLLLADLTLVSAGEYFAVLPFDREAPEALLEEAHAVGNGAPRSAVTALAAGDFFVAAVPWEGASATARAGLGNLLALATRDAVGRARRFAQPVAPASSHASAARYFQNLDWQGAQARAS
jgi:hypothetical protein